MKTSKYHETSNHAWLLWILAMILLEIAELCQTFLFNYQRYNMHAMLPTNLTTNVMFCFMLFLSIPNYTHAENSCANSITSSFAKLWGQRLNTVPRLLVEFQICDGFVICSASLQELASFRKKEKEKERWSKKEGAKILGISRVPWLTEQLS